jgi:hypothetical protein
MNLNFEWFNKPEDYCWHWGKDDLFRFRAQAWRLSVSWDDVPVSNALRQFKRDLDAALAKLKTEKNDPGSVTKKGRE